jgi:hypothetical protein
MRRGHTRAAAAAVAKTGAWSTHSCTAQHCVYAATSPLSPAARQQHDRRVQRSPQRGDQALASMPRAPAPLRRPLAVAHPRAIMQSMRGTAHTPLAAPVGRHQQRTHRVADTLVAHDATQATDVTRSATHPRQQQLQQHPQTHKLHKRLACKRPHAGRGTAGVQHSTRVLATHTHTR